MSLFVPLTVAQRFIYGKLAGEAAITTALGGASRIYPNISPADIGRVRHMTHAFAGPEGGVRATPLGQSLVQIGLRWDVTAWEPSFSQQALEPLMEAVQSVLIGPDGRGMRHIYPDGDVSYRVEVVYEGPVQVPLEVAPAGVWAPISERYGVTLRQVA